MAKNYGFDSYARGGDNYPKADPSVRNSLTESEQELYDIFTEPSDEDKDKDKKNTVSGGMGSKGFSSAADLYKRILGREPGPGEIEAINARFNIGTGTPAQFTPAQINEFRQAAKPELEAMSRTPGFRPNQMMDQFYQPVYQAQYKNYQEAPAQPVNFENKAVADLYRNILGRQPDVEGYNYFNKVFGSTVGPEQAQEFLKAAAPETRLSPRAAVMTQNPAGNMFQQQFNPFQQQQQQFSPFQQQQFSPFQQQFSPFQQQRQFSPFQQQQQYSPFQQQFSPFQQQQQFSPFQQQQQFSPFQQQRQFSPFQQGSNFGTMSNFRNTQTPFSSGSRGAFGGGFGGTSLYGKR
jgi:hypothetical protein